MPDRNNHHRLKDLGLILIVGSVYFLAAKLGLSLAFLNPSVSPVWPPTGVAIAVVFWLGYRAAPAVWLGALVANYSLTEVSLATATGISIGNALEAVVAVYLLRRFVGSRNPFNRAVDVLKFVGFAVFLSTMISATIGNLSLCLGGAAAWRNFGRLWVTWWLGDGVGALVVAPLILSWVEKPIERWSRRRWTEGALLLLTLSILSATIYTNLFLRSGTGRPWGHVTIPLLLWAAFRFGPRGVTTAIGVFSAIAIWGTLHGYGAFAAYNANDALLFVQAYVADLAITTLLLSAIVAERKHGQSTLTGSLAVTRILAESPALDDALPRILQRICATFDWEVGAMWIADSESGVLRCLKVWPPKGAKNGFEAICYETTFAPGIGLPGRVWKSLKPTWIPDVSNDQNFPRVPVAAAEGLRSAFAFPILSGAKFLGVMEFFSHEVREPDESLLAAFSGIGSQIGQFIERKRAEEALEPAKLLPSENPAPVMRLDHGRVLSYANPAALRLLESWNLSLGKEVPPELAQISEATLLHGDRRNVELPLGDQIYLVNLTPIVNANYVNLYFSDITDLKRTEEELLKNEQWLRLTMEGGRVGTWTRDLDESNRVIWTPELEEIFGLQPGEFAQTEKAFFDFVHPDDRQPLAEAVRLAIENHTDYTVEFRYTHKDGTQRWMLGRGRPFYDATGKPSRLAGIGWDITERKQAELDSRQLAAIVESTDDAVIAKDLNGVIISWNSGAEQLYGYKAEEMIGKPISVLIPLERLDEEPAILAKLRRGESIDHYQTVRLSKDGRRIDVSLTISPIRDSAGKVVGASKIARDITQQKVAEQEREGLLAREQAARAEAEAANRLKDEFLATLSHELRTPLTAMLGWLSIMRNQSLDQKTTEHAIETVERNARIQAQLIEDLMDVSRIVGGKLELEVRPVDLLPVIEAAVEVVRPAADAKGVEIQITRKAFVGPVSGDPARLQQVIWNLLSNAVKFTSRGESVDVILQRAGQFAEIVVRDNGVGIDPQFLPHVFERFRQADSPTIRSHRGLGLGLAIVRHLVELHGGAVRAESPGAGKGSTFSISLPLEAARVTKAGDLLIGGPRLRDSEVTAADDLLEGLRVLVVEDESDARELLSIILKRSGATVEAVESAQQALQCMTVFKPNVLVSDIGLPAESGYELIRKIRTLPAESCALPAIALTAFAGDRDRERALASGFQMHLAKPVDPNHVIEAVAQMAGRRSRKQ